MVNHWYLGGEGATACREHRDPMAYDISTKDPDRVSCPDCEDWLDRRGNIVDEEPLADWERELLEGCDPVQTPEHYRWMPVEAIEITELFNFNMGNALKYIIRADHKGKPVEDLRKAAYYVGRELKRRGFSE